MKKNKYQSNKYNNFKPLYDGYRRIAFESLSTVVHKHEDFYELLLITEGEWQNVTERGTHFLSSGTLVLFNVGATHQLLTGPAESKHLVMCISPDYFEDFVERLASSFTFENNAEFVSVMLSKEKTKYIQHVGTNICQNAGITQSAADEILFLALSDLVAQSLLSESNANHDIYISDIIQKLDNYYYMNESVEEICSHYPYSQSLLLRRFKDITGMTIVKYKAQQKLKYACQLLTDTETKIVDIAVTLQYSSLSYFLQRFKEVYGMTPTEYRGLHKNK